MVNDNARRSPEHNEKYCTRCGAETITTCLSCNVPIRGHYHLDGVVVLSGPTIERCTFACCHRGREEVALWLTRGPRIRADRLPPSRGVPLCWRCSDSCS